MKAKAFLAIFLMMALVTGAIADHQPTVSFHPSEMNLGETKSIRLVVSNAGAAKDKIIKIELSVPTDGKNKTFFDVKNLFELPIGWQSSAVVSEGKVVTVVFSALGRGIEPGTSKTFVLSSVTAPKTLGLYQFSWKTTDEKNETKTGFVSMTVKLGNLTGFVISKVPSEVAANESFNVTITAYAGDVVKSDYTGRVVFNSTDRLAKFEPPSYKFTPGDNGKKQITVTLNTPGNHTFEVRDETTGIKAVSHVIAVKAAVPRKLSVIINEGVEETDTTLVTLSIGATGAKECRYSNDKIFWTDYQPYVESKEWKLEPWEGEKTVYVQCRNEHGESEIAFDTIVLKEPFALSLPLVLSIVALIISVLALIVASKKKGRKKEESS